MKRLFPFVLVTAVLLGACGEAGVLDGVGDRTRNAVVGETTTTVPITAVAAGIEDEGLVVSSDALWFNDDIDPQYTGAAAEVVAAVWKRQLNSRFVQASRKEIAAALPVLTFPEYVPQQVRWVTSQLVYYEASGTLDQDTLAAFGLWAAEPYQSDTAQLGVLRVGRATIETPAARSELVALVVPDGVSVVWTESGHRYELFCRSDVSEDLCLEVASSSAPLALITP
ncbi:MAG: hypothetical protein ACR2N2_00530 [Acidimicrobiia bacterium]